MVEKRLRPSLLCGTSKDISRTESAAFLLIGEFYAQGCASSNYNGKNAKINIAFICRNGFGPFLLMKMWVVFHHKWIIR
jgi:hypothetical protein